jgi:hypothetical protein
MENAMDKGACLPGPRASIDKEALSLKRDGCLLTWIESPNYVFGLFHRLPKWREKQCPDELVQNQGLWKAQFFCDLLWPLAIQQELASHPIRGAKELTCENVSLDLLPLVRGVSFYFGCPAIHLIATQTGGAYGDLACGVGMEVIVPDLMRDDDALVTGLSRYQPNRMPCPLPS